MSPSSQNALILRDLKRGAHLTPKDALKLYRCFRLGARIYDLRKRGHLIHAERITDGDKHFSMYSLIKAAGGR